jgi:hypothetical protein
MRTLVRVLCFFFVLSMVAWRCREARGLVRPDMHRMRVLLALHVLRLVRLCIALQRHGPLPAQVTKTADLTADLLSEVLQCGVGVTSGKPTRTVCVSLPW